MAWDPEHGQDDLIKEDKTLANIKRALKRSRTDKPKDDDLYTDRNVGTHGSLEPTADSSRRAKRLGSKGPVKASPLQKARNAFASLRQAWAEAVTDAERRQQERRARKGK